MKTLNKILFMPILLASVLVFMTATLVHNIPEVLAKKSGVPYTVMSDKRPDISQLKQSRDEELTTLFNDKKSNDGFVKIWIIHWGDWKSWKLPGELAEIAVTYTLLGDGQIVVYAWRILKKGKIGITPTDFRNYIAFSDGPIYEYEPKDDVVFVKVISVEENNNRIKITFITPGKGNKPITVSRQFVVKGFRE
ncbi:hypothetical protein IIA95_01440 [Patescibacteria group bacterium]|nr:hypothetical protein [Patescibacteria group bacterium]